MIVEFQDQREYLSDQNYFLHDKTQSVFKIRTIKNQCVDLFSSMIEIFGDQAIQAIMLVIKNLLGQETPEMKEYSYESQHQNH